MLPALAETPTKVYKGSATPYFGGGFEPRQIESLNEIPAPIRAALERHLQQRLGNEFLANLEFSEGKSVDLEELHRVYPDSKSYRWEVFAYMFTFLVKQPHKDVEYHAQIELRKNGTILKEIDLPALARFPERGKFISLREALETAAKHGIKTEDSEAGMDYLEREGIIVFEITQYLGKKDYTHHIKRVRINAHTGEFFDTANLTADG